MLPVLDHKTRERCVAGGIASRSRQIEEELVLLVDEKRCAPAQMQQATGISEGLSRGRATVDMLCDDAHTTGNRHQGGYRLRAESSYD
eukprot:scaffold40574_cov27-Tisochrysis_lutea.AAC.2